MQELERTLGLSGLSAEAKEEIFQRLGENIIERTLLTIAHSLTENEAKEMATLFKNGNLESAIQYLSEKHPELNDTISLVCRDVANDFINA